MQFFRSSEASEARTGAHAGSSHPAQLYSHRSPLQLHPPSIARAARRLGSVSLVSAMRRIGSPRPWLVLLGGQKRNVVALVLDDPDFRLVIGEGIHRH